MRLGTWWELELGGARHPAPQPSVSTLHLSASKSFPWAGLQGCASHCQDHEGIGCSRERPTWGGMYGS